MLLIHDVCTYINITNLYIYNLFYIYFTARHVCIFIYIFLFTLHVSLIFNMCVYLFFSSCIVCRVEKNHDLKKF